MMHILEDEARRHNVSRITRVRLSVGLFTAVEPKTLEACFELYAEGTAAEGAELDITTVPAEGRCLECGHGFPMTSPRCRCPGVRKPAAGRQGRPGLPHHRHRRLLTPQIDCESS